MKREELVFGFDLKMASSRRKLSAEQVLAQLHDLSSDESGLEQTDSSEEEAVPTEEKSTSEDSSESEDEGLPLRKRVTIQQDVEGIQPTSERRLRSGSSQGLNQTVRLLPGKDGTIWEQGDLSHTGPRNMQNITRVAPGPKRHALDRIHSVTSALKLMLDLTMISWIVNFTQMEAER